MKKSLALVLFLVLLVGCLSRPRRARETFAIATPSVEKSVRTNGPVLAVQRIAVAHPFDNSSLAYRTGDSSFERDPYAGLLDSPGASFAEPVRNWLQNAGLFSAVVGPESMLKADYRLETSIEQLHGDFRDRNHPSAVLEMQFIFFEKSGHSGDNVIFQRTYFRRVPLKARTAAALVAGWNEALQDIMNELVPNVETKVQQASGLAGGR